MRVFEEERIEFLKGGGAPAALAQKDLWDSPLERNCASMFGAAINTRLRAL
jgi:hypothetical protein